MTVSDCNACAPSFGGSGAADGSTPEYEHMFRAGLRSKPGPLQAHAFISGICATATVVALLAAGCGQTSETSGSGLDSAGQNACYLFFKWVDDATTLNADETHSAVKKIYDGGGGLLGGSGAKDSSNTTIRDGARRMLEDEVTGDYDSLVTDGKTVGDECNRLAPS